MNRSLLSIALLLSFLTVRAQVTTLPAEAKPFVLKGYEMLDYATGDLNGDNKPDAILLLKILGEADTTDEVKRPLLLLIRQANGKLKQEKRNDDLVMCRQCGGVFGDPYEGITISKNGFIIDFYGGSNWRWAYHYRFGWKPAQKNWYLLSEQQVSYHSSDPDKMKTVNIGEEELGAVTVDNYQRNEEYNSGGDWEVTVAKTFFYDNPKLGSKPRKAYLLKGDKLSVTRVLTNFLQVSFGNDKGQYTDGFLLKKDLRKMN